MSTSQQAYGFNNVAISYGGVSLSGFMPGDDPVMFEYNEDLVDTIVGPDGSGTANINNNLSGIATLKFQDTSPSNDALNVFYLALQAGNLISAPLVVKDAIGNTLLTGLFFIKKGPTIKYGKNISGREWKLETTRAILSAGSVGQPIGQ